MKSRKNLILLLLFSFLAVPLLIDSCKKEEGKCTEETFPHRQYLNSFYNMGDNNATVNADGSIYYNFKFAFLEVCSYSSFSVDVNVDFNDCVACDAYEVLTPYAEVKMYDVYDRPIFDWTLMSEETVRKFRYQDASIVASPKEQEIIIWVEIRVVVPPSTFTAEEIHDTMSGLLLSEVGTTLTHHKPKY